MDDFYEQLAPLYHLIFPNWEDSIRRRGEELISLIDEHRLQVRQVLDVSCGIGTQALALSQRGYAVVASDISRGAVERAEQEAVARGLNIEFSVCDMRDARRCHGREFDVVITCDNSIAHLLTDADLLRALKEMHACVKVGGRGLVKPFGTRVENGRRYIIFQVWDFIDDHYDLSFFFIEEGAVDVPVKTHVMRSKCYAIDTGRLLELMTDAGFSHVHRLDGRFYQPVLVGTKS